MLLLYFWRYPSVLYYFRDPMEIMEQQLVRCGVPSVRIYEHLAMPSPVMVAAAAAATLGAQQQQQQQHHQPSAQQQQQHENALPPWLSPASTALLYGRGAAGSPSPYSTAVTTPGFSYPTTLSWPWQPSPVAMISRRSSPTTATSLRYVPYPPTASSPPPLRARPSSPN